jgi:acyl-CoA reductase-like NAD-dependent aldehyde dehydrogenase
VVITVPSAGMVITSCRPASPAYVDEAVAAARAAYVSWLRITPDERRSCFCAGLLKCACAAKNS